MTEDWSVDELTQNVPSEVVTLINDDERTMLLFGRSICPGGHTFKRMIRSMTEVADIKILRGKVVVITPQKGSDWGNDLEDLVAERITKYLERVPLFIDVASTTWLFSPDVKQKAKTDLLTSLGLIRLG